MPLAFLPAFARGLRETARFAAQAQTRAPSPVAVGALGAIAELLRRHPRRALAIALIGVLSSAGIGPVVPVHLRVPADRARLEPGAFAALTVVFGAFAIVGNPVAGRLGDRYGRRARGRAACSRCSRSPRSRSSRARPRWVALPWTVMVFLSMANTVCVRTLATELFPTSLRGTGAGSLALLETVGVGHRACCSTPRRSAAFGSQAIALPLVSLGVPRRGREHAARARDGAARARGRGGVARRGGAARTRHRGDRPP